MKKNAYLWGALFLGLCVGGLLIGKFAGRDVKKNISLSGLDLSGSYVSYIPELSIDSVSHESNKQAVSQDSRDDFEEHDNYRFPWQQNPVSSKEKPSIRHVPVKFWQEDFGLNPDDISGSILAQRTYKTEDGEGIEYYLQGYEHYYVFKNFGIEIGISKENVLDPQYYMKNLNNEFVRYVDSEYDVVYQKNGSNYIQRFKKDVNESFTQVFLDKYQAVSGCVFALDEYDDAHRLYDLSQEYVIFRLNPDSRQFCDKNSNSFVYFVYNPKKPDIYYKISLVGDCAPSCGVFKYLRFL